MVNDHTLTRVHVVNDYTGMVSAFVNDCADSLILLTQKKVWKSCTTVPLTYVFKEVIRGILYSLGRDF